MYGNMAIVANEEDLMTSTPIYNNMSMRMTDRANKTDDDEDEDDKRPPTGKPKLSRVASGYGGLMIPLHYWLRWSLGLKWYKKCQK